LFRSAATAGKEGKREQGGCGASVRVQDVRFVTIRWLGAGLGT
jgi:hypothetical protein